SGAVPESPPQSMGPSSPSMWATIWRRPGENRAIAPFHLPPPPLPPSRVSNANPPLTGDRCPLVVRRR
uniref:Uncharacterized protein n=2 Tax=Ixodes scapularis TaxID=6945 RepID=A0A1S4LTN8_IXOSC